MSSMKDYVDCTPLKIKHKVVQFERRRSVSVIQNNSAKEQVDNFNNSWYVGNKFDVQCGLNRKLLHRFQIQRKIDLHGCSQNEAFNLLLRFFVKCQQDEIKYVLVITGGNAMKASVLRSNFNKWVHDSFSEFVVSYSQAKLNDGGQGAFYVVIRKRFKDRFCVNVANNIV